LAIKLRGARFPFACWRRDMIMEDPGILDAKHHNADSIFSDDLN
jgi:hypothetical protein